MHRLKANRGFTLTELLIALCLLCILFSMIVSAMGALTNTTELADDYVTGNMSASYVIQTFQKDLVDATEVIVSEDGKNCTVKTMKDSTDYSFSKFSLLRNGKVVSEVLSGSFICDTDSLHVNAVLSDRSLLNVILYLGGKS